MKCLYYEILEVVNTFMKWILVVMICWGTDCQTIYEQKLYDAEKECLEQAAIVTEYAKQTYPDTSGQVWCLTKDEFENWIKPTSGA
jgi:hypothetical protein